MPASVWAGGTWMPYQFQPDHGILKVSLPGSPTLPKGDPQVDCFSSRDSTNSFGQRLCYRESLEGILGERSNNSLATRILNVLYFLDRQAENNALIFNKYNLENCPQGADLGVLPGGGPLGTCRMW